MNLGSRQKKKTNRELLKINSQEAELDWYSPHKANINVTNEEVEEESETIPKLLRNNKVSKLLVGW